MAHNLVKYNLNEDGTIPDYIHDGGYFHLGDDSDLIGVTKDVALPDGAVLIAKAELISRARSYYKDNSGTYKVDPITQIKYSNAIVADKVTEFLASVDLSDLA